MSKDTVGSSAATGNFNLNRFLVVLIPLAILVPVAVLSWGYFDIPTVLRGLGRPSLVKGSGMVTFAGQPLGHGVLETEHENPNTPGAVGYMDGQGRFDLKTEIDGNLVDGAYPGKHKVIVTKMDPTGSGMSFAAAATMTPPEYGSFESSPLALFVERDPGKNVYDFNLEGEPKYTNPAALASSGNQSPPVPREADPQQVANLVERTLEQNDANSDGKLSSDEVEKVQGFFRNALMGSDANKDGEFDRSEIEAAAKTFIASMPGGGGGPPGGGGRGKPKRPASEEEQPAKPAAEKPTDEPTK